MDLLNRTHGHCGPHLGSILVQLGPLGLSWAHLGSCLQPSCHPISPLNTFMADIKAPKLHLASLAKPSTCLTYRYVCCVSKACYLPSLHHVTLNFALQGPKIKPKSPLKHSKIGPRSPKIAQDGPEMAPKTCANQRVNPVIICLGALVWTSWAILAPLGPILGYFRYHIAIQFRRWKLLWPIEEIQGPILQALLSPSTCRKHCDLRWFSTVSHLPSSQHIA